MTKIKFKKDKIYAIYWQDAAFSFRKRLPRTMPPLQLTFGIIVLKNKNLVSIGMNCHYNSKNKKITNIRDGFLIPINTIIEVKEIGDINENK